MFRGQPNADNHANLANTRQQMSTLLYYADPDGNQMEFTVDCFASKDECRDYFAGEKIGENPVGTEYDPAQWLASLCAGEGDAELLAIDLAAPVSPIRGRLEALVG